MVINDVAELPERSGPFGEEMAESYRRARLELQSAAKELEGAGTRELPERVGRLIRAEAARARFEAAELEAMYFQQSAMNRIGLYLTTGKKECLSKGMELLKEAMRKLDFALEEAREFKLPEGTWYYGLNRWLYGEFQGKIKNYEPILSNC